jgi:branched-chain amino acid transport system permease protein
MPSAVVRRATQASRLAGVVSVVLVVTLATLPAWADSSTLRLFVEFACLLALAQMWNLLAGYGGLVSVGQQGYLGIGGYALVVLADLGGLNPFLCVPIAGVVAALAAIPISKVVFRLHGGYFAIGTWVVAESFRLIVSNATVVGGGTGTSLTSMRDFPKAVRESLTFWIALVVAVGAVAGVYWLLRSRHGLALTAIRDSERAAASQGVDIAATKFWVYLVAAFGCGVVGALYFLMNLRVSPDAAFGVSWTAFVIFIVVIGGIGTIEGPIIGTLLYFALRETLADFGTWYLIALGVVAVIVMVRFPRGLWGYVAARFDLHLFPVRRRLALPDAGRTPSE